MIKFINAIILLTLTAVIGAIVGGYLGYFVGMVYSLTNGWLLGISPATLASVFSVAGGALGAIFATSILWVASVQMSLRKDDLN